MGTVTRIRNSSRESGSNFSVFISYSRQDLAFVDRLQAALELDGVEVFVDREAIEKGEEWWLRIQQLITDADTIIFALSPGSVTSPVCQQEVDFAESLNKRLIPIVAHDLNGNTVPSALSRLNYIFFVPNAAADATGDFDVAVRQLIRALEIDIGWIREHTRLGQLAARWNTQQRPGDQLLRGSELLRAESWLTTRPDKAPAPTDAHRSFITESRRAATRRQRLAVGLSLLVAVAGLIVAGVALSQRELAKSEGQKALAALLTQSRLLNQKASEYLTDDNPVAALLLSLEAVPDLSSDDQVRQRWPTLRPAMETLYYSTIDRREIEVFSTAAPRALLGQSIGNLNIRVSSKVVYGQYIPHYPEYQESRDAPYDILVEDPLSRNTLTLKGHLHGIHSVALSPDGRYLASASKDNSARLWDLSTGQQLHMFAPWGVSERDDVPCKAENATGPPGFQTVADTGLSAVIICAAEYDQLDALSVAFDPKGELLLATFENGIAKVWRTDTAAEVSSFASHKGRVHAGAFHPTKNEAATAGEDKTIRIWDFLTGAELMHLEGHTNVTCSVTFSGDGKWIASGAADNTGRIWNAETGELSHELKGHSGPVCALQFSPDGSFLASGAADGKIIVWDVLSGNIAFMLKGHNGPVNRIRFSPDGQQIFSASDDGSVRTWRVQLGIKISSVYSKKSSEAGLPLVQAIFDRRSGDVSFRDRREGVGELSIEEISKSPALNLAHNSSHSMLGTGAYAFQPGNDETMLVVNSFGRKFDFRISEQVQRFAINGDRSLVALSYVSGRVVIIRTADSSIKLESELKGGSSLLEFVPNSRLIAFDCDTRDVCFLNIEENTLFARLQGHSGAVLSLDVDPQHDRAVTASSDGTVRVWETKSYTQLWASTFGKVGAFGSVSFDPTGDFILLYRFAAINRRGPAQAGGSK